MYKAACNWKGGRSGAQIRVKLIRIVRFGIFIEKGGTPIPKNVVMRLYRLNLETTKNIGATCMYIGIGGVGRRDK